MQNSLASEARDTAARDTVARGAGSGPAVGGSEDFADDRILTVSHSAFLDPITRMLLSSDGSTTRLLEAAAGPLKVRVLHQSICEAGEAAEAIRAALCLADDAQIVNRCSALVDGRLQAVSLNHVVAPHTPGTRLGRIVSGTAAGIGPELSRQHVEHRRELLACGLGHWPGRSGPQLAAVKVYVIWQGEQRLMYLREMFNPDVIPAATAGVAAMSPTSAMSPMSAIRADAPVAALPAPSSVASPSSPLSPPRFDQLPAAQQPEWPNPHEAGIWREKLAAMPGLVTSADCRSLLELTALASSGEGFVLQVGDCAETFDQCTQEAVEGRHALIRLLASAASFGLGVPVAAVGRIAGQFAKPRSSATEQVGGIALPAYRGDMVNDSAPTLEARRAQPERLFQAYLHSAAVLHALHNADQRADTAWSRRLQDRLAGSNQRHPRAETVLAAAEFAGSFGTDGSGWPRTYVSHEALVLDYEHALLRTDADGSFASSGHLLWIGERTRDLEGAHIAFAASIANPVAVKIGPGATAEEVLALCRRLNPARIPGKLALITRMGAERLRTVLPGLLDAVSGSGHPVVWICDPLHANTVKARSGHKTRRMDDVLAEITAFFDVHTAAGTHPGGLHLEAAAEDVTECVGGLAGTGEPEVPARYSSACDPRLHPLQALECVLHAVELADRARRRVGSAADEPDVTHRKWARRFDLYDTDGDGWVSRVDLEHFVTEVASTFLLPETSPKVHAALSAQRRLWASLSEHAGGTERLTRQQFVAAAQTLRTGHAEHFHSLVKTEVDTAVALADVRGDGRVEPAAFISFMTATGVPGHHAATLLPAISGGERLDTGQWSEVAVRYFTSTDPRDLANSLLGEVHA